MNMAATNEDHFKYIVVGGGIAGVTCAETLSALSPEDSILLLSASALVKVTTNYKKIARRMETFDVEEHPMLQLTSRCQNLTVRHCSVTDLNTHTKTVTCSDGRGCTYDKLCISAGGSPKVIAPNNTHVVGIRDIETVNVFQEKLTSARRILVVGNGGIATEIVYEVVGCEVVWAIKDESITSTFIDAGAAKFFLPHLTTDKEAREGAMKRTKYTLQGESPDTGQSQSSGSRNGPAPRGSALGPDWHAEIALYGVKKDESHKIHIEYETEVAEILTPEQFQAASLTQCDFPESSFKQATWPVYVKLTNGTVYGCDFVVSATGVTPAIQPFMKNQQFDVAADGGLCVNDVMLTSQPDVYAAGDACTATWEWSPFWQQMRLWSQARQMGAHAAQCMVVHSNGGTAQLDFSFELFTHMTTFFNFKVVLLGKYNAQGLTKDDYTLLLRVTPGKEYVKAVMRDGRMIGAILIGETDLEETFENLILNQTDLSHFGEELLDPNVDIEDFFD